MPKDAIAEELGAVKEELVLLRESFKEELVLLRESFKEELVLLRESFKEELRSTLEQKNAPRRPGRPPGSPARPGTSKVQIVFDLLKELNPMLPQENRWAFTKSFLIHKLKITPDAVNRFVDDYHDEIEQFHRDNGIDPDNHLQNKGNDLKALKKAIWERTQIVTVSLPLIEAEALLQAGEEGLSHLQKKKKSDDRIEVIDQALTRLDEAIGAATEDGNDESNSTD